MKLESFLGKRIWIIGASSGIGRALAEKLAREGAKLALSSRDGKALETLQRNLAGGVHISLALDTRDYPAIMMARDEIISRWGGFDILIFGAGIYTAMRAFEIDLEEAKRIFEINFTGALNAVTAALPPMLAAHQGRIVIISSVAAYRGLPNSLVYGASKAALTNFTETLYLDLKPRGIDVQLVSPGFVKTRMTDNNQFKMPALISPEEAADNILAGIKEGIFEIHFPKRFTFFMKLLRILPNNLYFLIARKFTGM